MGQERTPKCRVCSSAAFVRLSRKPAPTNSTAPGELCIAMESIAKQRPGGDQLPRIGVENRLPEFIEEAMYLPQLRGRSAQVLRLHLARLGGRTSFRPLFPLHGVKV